VFPVNDWKLRQVWRNRQTGWKVRPIGEFVGKILRVGQQNDARRISVAIELWRELVPEHVANTAWPVAIHRGWIEITARDPATAFEVQREIGMRFVKLTREHFPEWNVRGIKVSLASSPSGD
jgi:hypothetical protein